MDLRSGHPYWLVRNGLLHTFPALDRDVKCDVVIVGGGITGALVAHALLEAGFSAVLLDKRDIGWGSTAASTALLQYEIDQPLCRLQERFGVDYANRCYRACRDGIERIHGLTKSLDDDCGFAFRPSLFLARRRNDVPLFRREHEARTAAGFRVRFWDERTVAGRMRFARPCALYSEHGAQVDAYRLTYLLLARCQRLGLAVHDRTEVKRCQSVGSRVRVATDRGVVIMARHIVFATGYEAQEAVSRRLVKLNSSFALVSEPLPGGGALWHQDCLIWEHAKPYLYIRTTADRRIIVGGGDEPFQNADRRDSLIPKKTQTLLRKFRRLFPDMPVEVAYAWAGTFGETPDGLPYVDQFPEFRQAWFTLGFGGNGITYSAIAAEMVRDALLGKPCPYGGLFRFTR